MVARILEDDRYIGEKYFPALIPTEQFHAAQERRKEMRPEYKQTPAQKELRKLCGGIVPDSVARRVLKILNQVVDDPQLIKILRCSFSMVSTTILLNSGVYRLFGTPFGIAKHPTC